MRQLAPRRPLPPAPRFTQAPASPSASCREGELAFSGLPPGACSLNPLKGHAAHAAPTELERRRGWGQQRTERGRSKRCGQK